MSKKHSFKLILTLLLVSISSGLLQIIAIDEKLQVELDLEKELQLLNKEPIKSFQNVAGDIFDCIDIYKQPALDHPRLKNHKIQMQPTFSLQDASKKPVSTSVGTILEPINCPVGTVPIRRTRKEDLLRAKSFTKKYSAIIQSSPEVGKSRAFLEYAADESNKYFGAEGHFSNNNPPVEPDQSSWSLVWIESGDIDLIGNYSIIEAGWGVSPEVFGDSKARLIAGWSGYLNGEDMGGCYNDLCRGFVHTNSRVPFNYAVVNISEYEGHQYDMLVNIHQDGATKNWWLKFQNETLGYWVSDVVPHLADGADHISFGGITTTSKKGISPPMGYGKFPDHHLDHSNYIINLHAITKEGNIVTPIGRPEIVIDKPKCYNLVAAKDTEHDNQDWLTYGGPGGVCYA